MKKIQKEIIFLILCIISVLGTILSFIFLLQYIPEFFFYINNNWNNGYTDIIQKGMIGCKFPLFSATSYNKYKNYQKDFFNRIIINDNTKKEENINKTYFTDIFYVRYSQCIINRTNYFDTKLIEFEEGNDFNECKYIDSLNRLTCGNYSNTVTIGNFSKFTEVVLSIDQPCFDPRYYNLKGIQFNKTSYYYDKSRCPGNRVSKHYVNLKDAKIGGIIEVNKQLHELNYTLSEEIKNKSIYIYGRNYIGIKDKCKNKPFKKLNNVIEQKNNYIQSSINWIGYIIIVEVIFFLLFLNRFSVKYHNYVNKISINGDENHQMKELLPPYTKPMILILSFIMLGFHVLVFTYFLNIRDYINLFEDINCFEEEAGELIKSSIYFLIGAKYTQIIVLLVNVVLAFKFGIKKVIKYAN